MQHWKNPGIFKVFCGFLSSSQSWMKDPPWVFSNRGMFHLLCQFTGGYSQFLEASRKLQSWLNTPRNSDVLAYARAAAAAVPSSTGAPSLAFDGEIVVQLGQSWVSYRLVSAGSHMISSKIAQSLWIMSLGVSFAARNNTPGLSPDGKFQRCSVFQHVVVLTCERTFRTIEHQVSLNRQLSIRIVRNTPRFSTFWSPNKIPT